MRYYELFEINLHPREREHIGDRYRIVSQPERKGIRSIRIEPDDSENATTYVPRRYKSHQTAFYNPELSDLHTVDPDDEYINFTFAKPKAHLSTEIEPLPEPNIMYRGMSSGEFDDALKKGFIQSEGTYNIGKEQEGLTYWATEPSMAVSYANSFAPMRFKPTFKRPAYVVAAHIPAKTVYVRGTGSNEIGVPNPIPVSALVAIWRGRVYDFRPGDFDLRHKYDDEEFDQLGAGSGVSASVVWERLSNLNEAMQYVELKGTTGNWAPYIVRHIKNDEGEFFKVFQQSHLIATARLSHDRKRVTDISVLPEHQRRGIATALYNHIEQVIGHKLEPSHTQTDLGKKFWNSR